MSALSWSRSVFAADAGWDRARSEGVGPADPGWGEPFVVLMLVAACLGAVLLAFGAVAVPANDLMF